jgi:hypothetical protein
LVSSSDDVQLTFKRSGGQLGKALEPVELRGRDMSPEEAAAWQDLSHSGALDKDVPAGGSGVGGDQHQYDLTVRRGEQEQAFRFDEFDVPDDFAPLVQLLDQRVDETERRRGS